MHLGYSTSKHKGKTYKSYSITEAYRNEEGKPRKRTIWSIGKLTDEQAEQIRLICKVVKSKEQFVTQLKDIVVKESKAYLDIAVVDELWNRWRLDEAFDYDVTNSRLPTHTVAKILAINRCTDPCSHYSIPVWARKNALEDVLKIDLSGLNDDKIYYELDKIHKNRISVENHIFERTYSENPESYGFVDYDLTTSYFVGYKCDLSAFGKGKAECRGRRQVLLSVLINDEGYPFKWDVLPGNMAETKTLRRNVNACKTRFKLGDRNVTLVFDRGIISDENGLFVQDAEMKYISALDRNQILSCGVDLKPFAALSSIADCGDETKIPTPKGFAKYDDRLYFRDGVVVEGKRFVVGFNPGLFVEDRNTRGEKIAFFENYLKEENEKLSNAQRDREPEPTKNRVNRELNRLKIKKYFESPVLKPIVVQRESKTGDVKSIESFRVEIDRKNDIVNAEKLTDGVCVFVTNHIERQGRGFKVKPRTIINAYRNKTKIEDVFKNVKSFLKLRPFFVNTDRHVKAVYTICILSYFMNKYLANQRQALGEKDYLNSKELFAPFKDVDIAVLEDKNTGRTVKRAVELPADTQNLLEKLGMAHIVLK
ncbi:MAG: transposase [Proteobacteria bacterium]|nr:transposase [Pseudomonadota bacterium]